MIRKLLFAVYLIMCANLAHATSTAPSYRLIDLHTDGWELGYASAINASGVVAGFAILEHGTGSRPFTYDNGSRTVFGTLAPPGEGRASANGVNDFGVIAGESTTPVLGVIHAFVSSPGGIVDLGTLGGRNSAAKDVNNMGQVVGNSDIAGYTRGFLYENGRMKSLGSLAGTGSVANAINELGMITGYTSLPGGGGHAYIYANGKMTDIGSLGGTSSGNDINNIGHVVGKYSVFGGLEQGFLYADNVMTDLGVLPGGRYSEALGINLHDQIVGTAGDANDEFRAFLFAQGTMHDLNSLVDETGFGWTIKKAMDINDRGMIAAFGSYAGGWDHALLLVPIPEPAAGMSFAIGIGLLVSRRLRRP